MYSSLSSAPHRTQGQTEAFQEPNMKKTREEVGHFFFSPQFLKIPQEEWKMFASFIGSQTPTVNIKVQTCYDWTYVICGYLLLTATLRLFFLSTCSQSEQVQGHSHLLLLSGFAGLYSLKCKILPDAPEYILFDS